MSASIYAMTICLPLLALIVVFAMKYFSAIEQAKARTANEASYRQIAEQATSAQSETAAALSAIQTAVADVRQRLAAVETMLRTVE